MTSEAVPPKKLPVGISDFKDIVTGNYLYVDKTGFIQEVMDRGDKILLLPRPRRFGKTLNLSMLKYFFDCTPSTWPTGSAQNESTNHDKNLFDQLAISTSGSQYMDKMGQHPVISLSFREVKELDWNACLTKIKMLLQEEYAKHYYLLDSDTLIPPEKKYFEQIIDRKGNKGDYERSLGKLLLLLSRHYGKRAVILIDEYDAAIHTGFAHGYYEEIVTFMRNFLTAALKDSDQYLEKGVLTGIMRIAKESIFSGLNNPGVFTLLAEEFDRHFGFTENEVENLLKEFNLFHRYNEVREWYNGYLFGETVIYNPWSIINFLGSKAKVLKPYWINTSDNAIVESLLSTGGKELKTELELLIRGQSIEKVINDNIVLKHVESNDNMLWSFLLMGGYLKPVSRRMAQTTNKVYYNLAVPNREVRTTYLQVIDNYFSTKIENKSLETMLNALIGGEIKLFEKMLRQIVAAVFSVHDFGSEPEKVYHALVAGLLVWISDTHEIKSNRESGYGRYDIMIIPRMNTSTKQQPGYVIEFKTVDKDDNETVEKAIKAALKQIEDKKYQTELEERGIKNIKKLAIVFNGKDVHVNESR